jgi:hypothetical protein
MQDIHKTRFLAANYVNLQGLKAVPLGLLLLGVVLWANTLTGPASDLTFPLIFSGVMLAAAWGVQGYYTARFGRVVGSPRKLKLDLLMGAGGGILGLAAFLADVNLSLPFSCIGLVFSASFLAEYWRMQQLAPGRYLLANTVVYASVMLVVSLLPLLGLDGWWEWIGIKAQLLGVLVVASLTIVIAGVLGHWTFVRQLPAGEAAP